MSAGRVLEVDFVGEGGIWRKFTCLKEEVNLNHPFCIGVFHYFSLACKAFITYKIKIVYNQSKISIEIRINMQN